MWIDRVEVGKRFQITIIVNNTFVVSIWLYHSGDQRLTSQQPSLEWVR